MKKLIPLLFLVGCGSSKTTTPTPTPTPAPIVTLPAPVDYSGYYEGTLPIISCTCAPADCPASTTTKVRLTKNGTGYTVDTSTGNSLVGKESGGKVTWRFLVYYPGSCSAYGDTEYTLDPVGLTLRQGETLTPACDGTGAASCQGVFGGSIIKS